MFGSKDRFAVNENHLPLRLGCGPESAESQKQWARLAEYRPPNYETMSCLAPFEWETSYGCTPRSRLHEASIPEQMGLKWHRLVFAFEVHFQATRRNNFTQLACSLAFMASHCL
jgi:hypothetical protein